MGDEVLNLPAADASPQPCEEWVLREREERDGVTMDVVLASDPTTVIARDVCVPERVYGDIGSVRRERAKRIVEAADAFRAGVAAERERCAKIASDFTIKADRRIHPDIAWDEMNEQSKMVAHTTAQQIADAISGAGE